MRRSGSVKQVYWFFGQFSSLFGRLPRVEARFATATTPSWDLPHNVCLCSQHVDADGDVQSIGTERLHP